MQKGSILAVPDSLNEGDRGAQYIVEGIGYDFIPDVLCQGDVDEWIKTSDEESFQAVQVLMKNEGLLVGGSSGSSLSGAIRWLTDSEKGKRVAATEGRNVVVLLPDGFVSVVSFVLVLTLLCRFRIRNYMSKPWFLKLAMEKEPSPMANVIAQVLQSKSA